MKFRVLVAAAALAGAPAFAQEVTGDAIAGEAAFRECAACHNVVARDGTVLAGRGNIRTGPNLFGLSGRRVASVPGFPYSTGITRLGESGAVWNEGDFVDYVPDPTAYLREKTGDASVRSNMTFKLRNTGNAANIYAYLASLAQ